MAIQTYDQFTNTTGNIELSGFFVYVAQTVPLFIPLMLTAIFIILSMGSYITQRNLRSRGNLSGSLAVGGYITTVIAFLLRLIPNVINTSTVVIFLVISIITTLWFLFSGRELVDA